MNTNKSAENVSVTQAKHIAEVLLAFVAGAKIQFHNKHEIAPDWQVVDTPTWNWDGFNYRIAPPAPVEVWALVSNEAKAHLPLGLLASGTEAEMKNHLDRSLSTWLYSDTRIVRLVEQVIA